MQENTDQKNSEYGPHAVYVHSVLLRDKYMIQNSLVVPTVWKNREVITNVLPVPKRKLLRRWLSTKALDCSSVLL